ncbi:MAG: type II toxin-antitoxin system RelE/ParE family toxin [Deltaproteobacteria bacterium]|nr:MAG: type II toxin-antitoxin system RelE/ParE family toxin [Deltaproteobacteria bacterium]TMA59081.1 MAG: type II toxin-antitoxin system RelE/ParE family toxin [Deltaproteobacteria bacterium]
MPSWTVSISSSAQKSIRRAPRHERDRLLAELDRLAVDPLGGNTVRLHGLPNTARRRVGDWRIIFELDFDRRVVVVADIVRRTTTTYRRH